MQETKKKLTLGKETIRNLSYQEMKDLGGAYSVTPVTPYTPTPQTPWCSPIFHSIKESAKLSRMATRLSKLLAPVFNGKGRALPRGDEPWSLRQT